MKILLTPLLVLLTFLSVSPLTAQENEVALPLKGGENILFIGNSLTAGVPERLNSMLEANGLSTFNGHTVLIWNQTFETHWTVSRETHADLFKDDAKEGAYQLKGDSSLWKQGQYDDPKFVERGYILAQEALEMGTPDGKPWDIVILQGYSAGNPENDATITDNGSMKFEGPFLKYGELLIDKVREIGAQPVLYQAWLLNPSIGGGNENPESYYNTHFDRLIQNYKLLGNAKDTPIIPVGQAMRRLSAGDKPEGVVTEWLIRDNVHGTAAGHALVIYTFASALTGQPAPSLQYQYVSKTKWDKGRHYVIDEPEERYNTVITGEIDDQIKKIVWEEVQQYCPWVEQ